LDLDSAVDERTQILTVDHQDPSLPAFIIKNTFRPEIYLLYLDGSKQMTRVEQKSVELIAYLPDRQHDRAYLIGGIGPYHDLIVVYRFSNHHQKMELVLQASDPLSIQPKRPGDFLLIDKPGFPTRLLMTSQAYGNGQSGSVKCYELPDIGEVRLLWETDAPLFSNPRPLLLDSSNTATRVLVDNRSHLARIDIDSGHVLSNERYCDASLSFDRVDGYWSDPLPGGIRVRLASDAYNKFVTGIRLNDDGKIQQVWSRYFETGFENQKYAVHFFPHLVESQGSYLIPIQIASDGVSTVELLDAMTGHVIHSVSNASLVVSLDPGSSQLVLRRLNRKQRMLYVFDVDAREWRHYRPPLGYRIRSSSRFGSVAYLARSPLYNKGHPIAYSNNGPAYLVGVGSEFYAYVPRTGIVGSAVTVPKVTHSRAVIGGSDVYLYRDAKSLFVIRQDRHVDAMKIPPSASYFVAPDCYGYFEQANGKSSITYASPGKKPHTVVLGGRLYEAYATTGVIPRNGRMKLIVHNAQNLLGINGETGTVDWRLQFASPYQCSRNMLWVDRGQTAAVLVMFDSDILLVDAETGRIVKRAKNDQPSTAFFFRPARETKSHFALADGNGLGLLDTETLSWLWRRDVPAEAQELISATFDYNHDGTRDVLKPWTGDEVILVDGATGTQIQTYDQNALSGIVGGDRNGGDAILTRSNAKLRIERFGSPIETRDLSDDCKVVPLSEAYVTDCRNGAGIVIAVERIDRKTEIPELKVPCADPCNESLAAGGSFIAIAHDNRVVAMDFGNSAQIADVTFPSGVTDMAADLRFSPDSMIVVTESGDLYWLAMERHQTKSTAPPAH